MRLDLAKFLEEQKFCKIAISGLLTPSQTHFCERQAKQVVRRGDVKSQYSSDEEFCSDDSVHEALEGGNKIGFKELTARDHYHFVDAMTNRMNETDQRLLKQSISYHDELKSVGDVRDMEEGASAYRKQNTYVNESEMSNQNFGPKKRVGFNDMSSRLYDDERTNLNMNLNATLESRADNNLTRITDSMRKIKSNFVSRKQAETIEFMPVAADDTSKFGEATQKMNKM